VSSLLFANDWQQVKAQPDPQRIRERDAVEAAGVKKMVMMKMIDRQEWV
jgi:hypothetical protein